MPKLPLWISKPVFLFLILTAGFIQFRIIRYQLEENDLCQHFKAIENFNQNKPIYQFFRVSDCWEKSIFIDKQYPAYPPTTLLLIYPLTKLGLTTATLIWDILDVAIYLLLLITVLAYVHKLKLSYLAIIFLFSISWSGLMLAQTIRNFSILLAFFIILSLATLQKHPKLAGFLIGISTLIKLWPLGFLFLGILAKKYHIFTFFGLATTVFGLFLTIPLFGFANFRDYFRLVPAYEHIFLNFPSLSLTSSLAKIQQGAIHRFYFPTYPPLSPDINIYFVVAYWLVLGYLIIQSIKHFIFSSTKNPHLYFAFFQIFLFMFGPLSWSSTAILLLIPLAIFIRHLFIFKRIIKTHHLFCITLGFFPLFYPEFFELPAYLFAFLPIDNPLVNILFYSVNFLSAATPIFIVSALSDLFTKSQKSLTIPPQ